MLSGLSLLARGVVDLLNSNVSYDNNTLKSWIEPMNKKEILYIDSCHGGCITEKQLDLIIEELTNKKWVYCVGEFVHFGKKDR